MSADDLARLTAQVAEVRAEAAGTRVKLRDTEAELQREKAAREAVEAAAKAASIASAVELAILRTAPSKGIIDPSAAVALIDRSKIAVSDDGTVDAGSVATALDALVAERSYLRGGAPSSGAPVSPGAGGPPPVETDAQRRARLYGGGGSVFDSDAAKAHGGGVVWGQPPGQGGAAA